MREVALYLRGRFVLKESIEVAIIEGCPHVRSGGGLYQGFHCTHSINWRHL